MPEPRSGRLLQDRDTGETTAYGPGLLAGYRHPVVGNALYVGVTVGVTVPTAVGGEQPGFMVSLAQTF